MKAKLSLMQAILAIANAILSCGSAVRADPLDTWTLRYDFQKPVTRNGIVYGNGLFVTVGDNGAVETSADAVSWVQQPTGTNKGLDAVAYGNGLFVAVGDFRLGGMTVFTSSNGPELVGGPPT